jgi:hypothetical protein
MPGDVTLTHGLQTFVPLGYRPASAPGALVPTYPPGFPWMLAAAGTLGLERFVVPLSAAGVVWLTFLFGRRLGGTRAGLIGAAFAAGCPSLWYQAMQPMSDVPATFWLTASGLLLTRPSTAAALGAGLAAAMGGLVRPNLFVLAPVLACAAVWWHRLDATARRRRAAAFLLPVVVAAAGFAGWQRALFGGPTETGYGSVADLFSLEHVLPNLARYPAWVLETQTPLILAALAAPLVTGRRAAVPPAAPLEARRVAWVGLLVPATLLAFYALYLVFDEWVYVRFLLPALPWMFVLSGAVLAWAAERLPPRGLADLVTLAAALMIATAGIERAREAGALDVGAGERRFVAMADLVRASPPDAVVLAMQHSGSLAYYTDRVVIRWDWIEPAELPGLLETLRARGRAVYAVLDDWEVSRFNDRFARVPFVLPARPLAADGSGAIAAAAYRLTDTTADGSGAPVSR